MTEYKNGLVVKAVKQVIDEMPENTNFHGDTLKNECVRLYPELKRVYVDSFLRTMRAVRKQSYVLKNRSESLYQKVGAQIIHKENIKRPELKKYENMKQQSFDFGGGY